MLLARRQSDSTSALVEQSYSRIACGYDEAWTTHMRDLSLQMLDHLMPPPGATCIDLTCGTGFIARELANRTGGRVIGVDASGGMLDVAHRQGGRCEYIHSDILAFLQTRNAASADVITCGWGLGYSQPGPVLRQIARALRSGGHLGVIDNSLFSLAGVLWAAMRAFAEKPEALAHVMKVQFLPSPRALAFLMRRAGLMVLRRYGGSKTYYVPTGREAIERLTATGAAAGFEHAVTPQDRAEIFSRFAQIMEEYKTPDGIPITHRYLAVIGKKP